MFRNESKETVEQVDIPVEIYSMLRELFLE